MYLVKNTNQTPNRKQNQNRNQNKSQNVRLVPVISPLLRVCADATFTIVLVLMHLFSSTPLHYLLFSYICSAPV